MKKSLLSVFFVLICFISSAQLSVVPNQTATNLANYLLGGGVTIANAQLTCPTGANAIFTNGGTTNLGLNSGVVLTTGLASSIPNANGVNASTNNGAAGLAQMAPITGTSSNFDGCMLEFDITPHCSPLKIRYKFASEEYPEYVNAGFNDGFGFFISGPNPLGGNYTNFNLATVPGSSAPVTIDNINSSSNSAYYITNTGGTIVYDGMTTVLTGSANVTPCSNYHLILAITDGGDAVYDSGVFLEQSGISCNSPTVTAAGAVICAGQSATLTASGTTTYSWSTGSTASSIVVSPVVTTTYTVGGSNIGVCVQSSKVVTVTVNPAPTANAGSPAALTCAATSTTLVGSGGGTYAWSGPGIVSGGTTANPTVNAGGTYSLIVTAAGCPSLPSTVAVTANTTPPAPTASSPSTLTCSSKTITLTGTGGGTYSWSGPGITAGAASSTPSVNLPGTYNLTVTAANGCTATANTSVAQNTTAPSPTASNSSTLTCSVTTIGLTGSGGGTYNWSGPGVTSGGATATPSVNLPGTYNLTVTAANGCTATANTSVSQNTTAPSPTASNSTTLTCSTTTAALAGSGGGTYSWSGPGTITGGTTANPVVNTGGTFTVLVTAANGCTATANTSVAQNTTAPAPTASNSTTLTCSTTAAVLTGSGGGSYNWSGPGITGGATSSSPTVNLPGTYNLTVTAANGCTATANTAVTQNTATPIITATSPAALTCSTTTVSLTGTGGGTYVWSGPGITSGSATSNPSVNLPGTYNLTVTAANGCTATANTAVTQNTATPSVTMPSTQTITCASPTVSLIGSAGPSSCTPVWTGGACAGSTSYTASACAPGNYSLTVTDPANGCVNTGTVDVVPSIGIPVVTASSTGSITCSSTTAEVAASTTMTPVSYSWTGPSAVIGASTPSGTVSAGGTYQCVVTNTITGCTSTITTVVPTNTTPVAANVAPSASLTCSTNSVTLSATPTGTNYSYSWTGAGAIVSGGTTENPVVNTAGSYVVTMTDNINGCSGSFTVTVPSNTTVPTLSLSANSVTTTCSAPTITLYASSDADPSSAYAWTVPVGGVLSSTTSASPIAGAGGVYDVVVTNSINGCVSAPQSATVTADANIPTFTLTTTSASLTCISSSETVTLSSTASDLTYSWSPTPSSGANTNTPTFNTPGLYTCVITNTINNCSTGAAQVTVVSNTTAPTITTTNGLLTCSTTSVTISTVTTPTSGISYTWTGPGIIGSNSGSSVDVNVDGNYDVSIIDAANGCTNTATSSVTTNTTAPTLTINSTSSVLSCSNATITLNATSSVTDTPTWSTPSGSSTNPVIAGIAGDYIASVTDATNGCSTSQTLTVTGSTVIPSADAGTNASIPCGNPSIVLNGTTTSTDVVTYDWSGPNATSISGPSNIQNPTVIDAGVYTLTVTNTANGCSSTATINVTQSNVTASITANPLTGIAPLSVSFTNGSVGASTYSWNFGDGNISSVQDPNNIFMANGIYTVTLIASAGPCADTAIVIITVNDGLTLEIPNVFTPNGDNSNDVFTIKSTGVKEISLQIFNRWGQKLYEFTGPKASWDGTTPNGALVPGGTYFYFVKATGFDDSVIEKNGTVTLFR